MKGKVPQTGAPPTLPREWDVLFCVNGNYGRWLRRRPWLFIKWSSESSSASLPAAAKAGLSVKTPPSSMPMSVSKHLRASSGAVSF
eukprot:4067970-Prymnesium_polylepis.1